MNNDSRENVASKSLVKAMGLVSHNVGWIEKGSESKVNEVCKVPFSIGKHYKNEVKCDVIDMDAYHLLLGKP